MPEILKPCSLDLIKHTLYFHVMASVFKFESLCEIKKNLDEGKSVPFEKTHPWMKSFFVAAVGGRGWGGGESRADGEAQSVCVLTDCCLIS